MYKVYIVDSVGLQPLGLTTFLCWQLGEGQGAFEVPRDCSLQLLVSLRSTLLSARGMPTEYLGYLGGYAALVQYCYTSNLGVQPERYALLGPQPFLPRGEGIRMY